MLIACANVGNGWVGAQVALSLILLIAAGLFVRTFQNLKTLDPGFVSENLLPVCRGG